MNYDPRRSATASIAKSAGAVEIKEAPTGLNRLGLLLDPPMRLGAGTIYKTNALPAGAVPSDLERIFVIARRGNGSCTTYTRRGLWHPHFK